MNNSEKCSIFPSGTRSKPLAELAYAMFDELPDEVEQAIVSLSGLTDDDCFHLMVALALQIKHGVYQQ